MHYFQLLAKIMKHGKIVETRGLKTKELNGVILDCDKYNFFSCPSCRDYDTVSKYMFGELSWYLSGERDITNILPYSKFWGNIRNADNTANSNYGDLVFYRKNSHGLTSFQWAVRCLNEDKLTRKAIVLYNDRELFYPNNNDLICNQYQHFLIRDNKLDCYVGLRSSDAIMGLQFNVPWWSLVHQQLYTYVVRAYPKVKLGSIRAFISSSHVYENKWELAEKMLADEGRQYHWLQLQGEMPLGGTFSWYEQFARNYYRLDNKRLLDAQ